MAPISMFSLWTDATKKPWKIYILLFFLSFISILFTYLLSSDNFFRSIQNYFSNKYAHANKYSPLPWLILVDVILVFVVSLFIIDGYAKLASRLQRLFNSDDIWREYGFAVHSVLCAVCVFFALALLLILEVRAYIALMVLIYYAFCQTNIQILHLVNDKWGAQSGRQYQLKLSSLGASHGSFYEEENKATLVGYFFLLILVEVCSLALNGRVSGETIKPEDIIKAFGAGAAVVHFVISAYAYRRECASNDDDFFGKTFLGEAISKLGSEKMIFIKSKSNEIRRGGESWLFPLILLVTIIIFAAEISFIWRDIFSGSGASALK